MKVVKPVKVNDDAILTASTIAEPDLLAGEVEWEDRSKITTFGSHSDEYYASAEVGGFIYCVGGSGVILKIDTENKTTSEFGSYSSNYNAMILANDGNIYCVGSGTVGTNGSVMKIDIASQSVSFFGSYESSMRAMVLVDSGDIYCAGVTGAVIISVASQSVISVGAYSQFYYCGAAGNDGAAYFFGYGGKILKITSDQAVSEFDGAEGYFLDAATDGEGAVYAIGSIGSVLKLKVIDQTISFFGSYSGRYTSASIDLLGDIYCAGNSLPVLKVSTTSNSIYKLESTVGAYESASLGEDGNTYFIGETGEVAYAQPPYAEDDQVIKLSTHKIYQAVTATYDDPEVGVDLTVPSWVQVSATNKYKAFDDVVTTSTESSDGSIVMTIKPGQLFDSIAGLNCQGVNDVNIVMTDPTEGEVYNKDISMQNNGDVIDWYSYLWTDIEQSTTFAVFDMPPYSNATVTVTLTGGSNLSVGVITTGKAFDLGVTQYKTGVQLLDFSRIEEDAFGNLDIEKRVPSNLVDFVVTVESKSKLDYVYSQLKSLVGEVALYIGEEESPKEMTSAYGLHRNIKLNKNTPTSNTYTLQVRGLV